MRRLLALFLLCAGALAQGIIIDRREVEPGRVRLQSHTARIQIRDQVAEVDLAQVFFNTGTRELEGIYLFPLPENAAVSRFTMTMDGKEVAGEILDANRAREIYRSIVMRRKDPGLLEYAGRGCLRASIFPIPPRGETRVTLHYTQPLEMVGGLVEMVCPLKSDGFAPGPVAISGSIEIEASAGVATIFSPSHKLEIVRKADDRVVASFEESQSAADRDLRLQYGLGRKEFGLSLTSHRPAGEDGYFLMLLSPRAEIRPEDVLPKDIVYVVDTSGSMGERGGKKMEQAKAALAYALGRLNPADRFNIIAFSTEARPFRDTLVRAEAETVKAAVDHVAGLTATGGTAIYDALRAALKIPAEPGRVPLLVFLTDGMPTVGPTDTETILKAAQEANVSRARIFVFGVGDDVNTSLLTDLADRHRGAGHYVSEKENIELKVSALVDKVAAPAMTDVEVTMEGAGEYDLFPRRVGDLFHGDQAMIVGRYRKAGPRQIVLRGRIGTRDVSFVYEAAFGEKAERDYLPRLWAVRKVGFLLGEIRRNGELAELVDEVKRLAIRHGIVTPYTSFLVADEREIVRRIAAENSAIGLGGAPAPTRGGGGGERLRDQEEMDRAKEAFAEKKESGAGAVAGARRSAELSGDSDVQGEVGVGLKLVGAKSFRLVNGVWTDTSLPEKYEARKIAYLSEEYLKLLDDTELARYLSVGDRVVVEHKGVVYEIAP